MIKNELNIKFEPHPQLTSPFPTDLNNDLFLWAENGVSLRSMCSGIIKYLPSPSGTPLQGTIVIETISIQWASLVQDSDYLLNEQIPSRIYYENISRNNSEDAIRTIIRGWGNPLRTRSEEDIMVNDFFSGLMVTEPFMDSTGNHMVDSEGNLIVMPLFVNSGTELGNMMSGSAYGISPDPNLPNAIFLRLRKLDDSIINIVEIVNASFNQCKADPDWIQLYDDLEMVKPSSINTRTNVGQSLLTFLQVADLISETRMILEADRQIYQQGSGFTQILNHNQNALNIISMAENHLYNLSPILTDQCNIQSNFDFEVETMRLFDFGAYIIRSLYKLYHYIENSNPPTVGSNTHLQLDVITDRMIGINQTMIEMESDPHGSARQDIIDHGRFQDSIFESYRFTSMVTPIIQIAGFVTLFYSIIQTIGSLANLLNVLRDAGGFGFLSLKAVGEYSAGTIFMINGRVYTLASSEILVLVSAGVLTAESYSSILLSRSNAVFNPQGKGPRHAENWVRSRGHNWRRRPADKGPGEKWVDENGEVPIRYMKPNKSEPEIFRSRKLGYWRLRTRNNLHYDRNGKVCCWRDGDNLKAFLRDSRKGEIVHTRDSRLLTNGDEYFVYPSKDAADFFSHVWATGRNVPIP